MIPMTVTTHSHSHSHTPDHAHPHADVDGDAGPVTRIRRLAMFLEAHFGDVELHMPDEAEADPDVEGENGSQPALLVRLDEADAVINLVTLVSTSALYDFPCTTYGSGYRLLKARAGSYEDALKQSSTWLSRRSARSTSHSRRVSPS